MRRPALWTPEAAALRMREASSRPHLVAEVLDRPATTMGDAAGIFSSGSGDDSQAYRVQTEIAAVRTSTDNLHLLTQGCRNLISVDLFYVGF